MNNSQSTDPVRFDSLIRSLEAELANAGVHLTVDAAARQAYVREISAMALSLRQQAQRGSISWAEAAAQAQATRNIVMELMRARSSPVGTAMAQRLKSEGRTLNELIARRVTQRYGKDARFDKLLLQQRQHIYAEIVESAGRSNPGVTSSMRRLSYAGRGLIALSLALSVYAVATADDKLSAAGRETAVTGTGVAGGFAGGALAGLACGPGAPVCVTLGAFVGGALAALGIVCFL